MDRAAATTGARAFLSNVEKVIRGKRWAVEASATALFAGGHLLIEDVPGVGKTMLARTIARSIRGSFKRVQATPDLLPSDVTGTSVYNQKNQEFEFLPGPIFANVVLIDEINRTTPRTQSALLEAMDENAVTTDGIRRSLPDPLFVVATQNPLEHHGTYPLPEGQLDRFAIAMGMGYVDLQTEREVVRAQLESHPIEELDSVLTPDEVVGIRKVVRTTHVADPILDYALAITTATRRHPDLELGASPRASITLVRCAQARALIQGREFVVPDDVKALAPAALAHRIIPTAGLRLEQDRRTQIVRELVEQTEAPVTSTPPPPPAPPS
ncbi:MAG TPA: MoxR family ATPase [Actinomycetota bacterium]|nr:MoxR family ATPase [Actinomycetota bacterium]